jgi:hypothetical protein
MGQDGGAESGAARPGTDSHEAATDPDLQRIVSAWPVLPEHVRAAIMALIPPRPGPKN